MTAFIANSKKILLLLAFYCISCNSPNYQWLYSVTDPDAPELCGYANAHGEIAIPLGKYSMCFTDTLKTYAIVLKDQSGFVAIDRDEKVLFEVFPFDNGPDYQSEGLFRIMEEGKLGFADVEGNIVIAPRFGCAHPFQNGRAKVATECTVSYEGEHSLWNSDDWFYIDRTGKRLE